MKDLFTVTKFTMKDILQRKSFIITTIIFLIMIIIGFNIPNLIKLLNKDSNIEKLLIIDSENIFDGTLENLKDINKDYEIQISNDTYDMAKDKIINEKIDSVLFIEKQDEKINIKYLVKNASLLSQVPEDIISTLNTLYTNLQINKLGLTEEQIKYITPEFNFELEQTDEKANGNILTMMLLSLVLFYAIYFCAYQVSSSITTEKTSKIIETLGTALISAKTFLEPGTLDSILDLSTITPYLGIITIIYFIFGYFEYALLYALTGSTVSKPEDIQSANGPVAILAVIGFYLSYFTMMNPTSNLNLFASLFPISSPFCMPFRIMMGLAKTTDVLISILILILTGFIISKIAIKIYSNAILNYGTKMSLNDIIKMYKKK